MKNNPLNIPLIARRTILRRSLSLFFILAAAILGSASNNISSNSHDYAEVSEFDISCHRILGSDDVEVTLSSGSTYTLCYSHQVDVIVYHDVEPNSFNQWFGISELAQWYCTQYIESGGLLPNTKTTITPPFGSSGTSANMGASMYVLAWEFPGSSGDSKNVLGQGIW